MTPEETVERPDDAGEWDEEWDESVGETMTPEEKIAALVEHIKKEFPHGCSGVECETCPLDVGNDTSFEHDVCMVLSNL